MSGFGARTASLEVVDRFELDGKRTFSLQVLVPSQGQELEL